MSKVLMDILGLSTSPSSGGAYALILSEDSGNRRLPIIIGTFEAQAIALELENIKPPRPMTHDLLKNFVQSMKSDVKYVHINNLAEGTFYASIVIENNGDTIELDSRPSDAIALAVRFKTPIYVDEDILEEAGILTEQEEKSQEKATHTDSKAGQKELSQLEHLEAELKTAIETENYEKAAKIRDRISKLKG